MAKKDFIVLIGLLAASISTDAYASLDVDTQRALAPAVTLCSLMEREALYEI